MTHDMLVYIAKTFGLIWMMGFFLIVVIRTFNPRRRAAYDHAARSILPDGPEDRARPAPPVWWIHCSGGAR